MSVGERDPHTGHMTTGHEWNGITELNTPVPKPVWFFLLAAFLFGVGYWVLMPAWPYGVDYTRGLLGIDQRQIVNETVKLAAEDRAGWTDRVAAGSFAEIEADPALMGAVRETGHMLFGDNCLACHGADAKGGPGYPNIAQSPWLWGGDQETLLETLRVGINSDHADTRIAQMPAFGRDKMLERPQLDSVVDYVRTLTQPALIATLDPGHLAEGKEVFADNCAACHGDTGTGSTDLGAPDLTDAFWIYGGDRAAIEQTVFGGRQGHMPAWEPRLTEVQRKIVALYLLDLRANEK